MLGNYCALVVWGGFVGTSCCFDFGFLGVELLSGGFEGWVFWEVVGILG